MTNLETFIGASYDLADPNSLPSGEPDFSQTFGQGDVRRIVLGTMLAQIGIVPQDVSEVTLLGYDCDAEMQGDLLAGTTFQNGVLTLKGKLPFKEGSTRSSARTNFSSFSGGDINIVNGVVMGGGYFSSGDSLIINGREVDVDRGMKLVLIVPTSVDITVDEIIGAVGISGQIGGTLDFSPRYQTKLYGLGAGRLVGDLSGSGKLHLEEVQGDAEVEVSGSGKVILGRAGGKVDARISGSGSCVIETGTSQELRAKVSGSGKIIHRGLVDGPANLSVSGSGKIEVKQVNGEVTQKITGSGKIEANGQVYRPKWH